MKHIRFRRVTYIMAAVFLNVFVAAAEEEIARPEQLVTLSQATLEHFIADPNMTWFRNNVSSAKAIFIVPELLKAGFGLGAPVAAVRCWHGIRRLATGVIRPSTLWGMLPLACRLVLNYLR